jgi:hypothetical protein
VLLILAFIPRNFSDCGIIRGSRSTTERRFGVVEPYNGQLRIKAIGSTLLWV